MGVEATAVDGLAALVEAIIGLRRGLEPDRPLWFRGLPCADYDLRPSIVRDADSAEAMFDRELRLLTRFRQRSMPFWPAGYPQTDWEHLFVMQHHGVPTRLLDWSENLFVALFFTVYTEGRHAPANGGHVCSPTLWCLDPIKWNQTVKHLEDFKDQVKILTTGDQFLEPYKPESVESRFLMRHEAPVAMFGSHNSARIVAQRGTFTLAGKGLDSLDEYIQEGDVATLHKFTLPLLRTELQADLEALGFTESMIFPDLPALARELSETER